MSALHAVAINTETPVPPLDLSPLVARAQDGDEGAFALLYRHTHKRVYASCVRLLGDRQLAEELTQDTFIKAWQQLKTYRAEAQFTTWLTRVAINCVISYQRKHGPWLKWLRSGDDDIPEVSEHEQHGLRRDLDAAIAKLPMRARQVFVLVDVEGYTHEEAAELLHIASGTSKAQLFRARDLLRGWLQ